MTKKKETKQLRQAKDQPTTTINAKQGIDSDTLLNKKAKSLPFQVETIQAVNVKLNLLDKEIDQVWHALKVQEKNQYQLGQYCKRLNDSLQSQNQYLAMLVDKVKLEAKPKR